VIGVLRTVDSVDGDVLQLHGGAVAFVEIDSFAEVGSANVQTLNVDGPRLVLQEQPASGTVSRSDRGGWSDDFATDEDNVVSTRNDEPARRQ